MGARYLLIKGTAGMGNRISMLLHGIAYARLSERTLVVDWSDGKYSDDGRDVFHRLFDCPVAGRLEDLPADATVAPACWRGHVHRSLDWLGKHQKVAASDRLREFSIDTRRLDYSADIAVAFGHTFLWERLKVHAPRFPAEWQFDRWRLMRKLLADHVSLRADVRREIDLFAERHFTTPTIGIHVRLTDNMIGSNRLSKGISLPDLEAALARSVAAHPGATVFAATDHAGSLARLQARYPSLVSRPKWFAPEGKAIHQSPRCPDKLAMARDALVDMHLLAACDVFVCSSVTSYARIAQMVSRSGQQVIDVDKSRRPFGFVDRSRARLEDEVRWWRTKLNAAKRRARALWKRVRR